jgi:YegS/Rv2252/BmrU family lipid kinase
VRIRLILNPAAGHNRRATWLLPELQRFAASHGPNIEVATTRAPGHATELAADAATQGFTAAVAVGGDGTANEVAQGLVGTSCALGLVPRGSGNGLARHLRIPLQVPRALALLAQPNARVRAIDTGTADGRLFINACGCGYDAEIAQRFASSTQRGFLVYAKLCLQSLRNLRTQPVTIEAGAVQFSLEALLVTVANSPQYGNEAEIAPGARVDDGALDLVAVQRLNAFRAVGLATRLFRGNFDRHPAVRRLAGTDFLIRRCAPGPLHTDGEPHVAPAEVRVTVRPQSLRIITPR